MHGLDAANWKTIWKAKYKECYGCPVCVQVGDTEAAVMPKGDILHASDGKKPASQASTNYYQSPVVQGDIVYS